MQNKYIIIKLMRKKPKTNVYEIINISSQTRIGVIKWYSRWRQYCFFPNQDTIWNSDCMALIIIFLETANKAHKENLAIAKRKK